LLCSATRSFTDSGSYRIAWHCRT